MVSESHTKMAQVAHFTASEPTGPWDREGTTLPVWSHCPSAAVVSAVVKKITPHGNTFSVDLPMNSHLTTRLQMVVLSCGDLLASPRRNLARTRGVTSVWPGIVLVLNHCKVLNHCWWGCSIVICNYHTMPLCEERHRAGLQSMGAGPTRHLPPYLRPRRRHLLPLLPLLAARTLLT